MPVSKFNVVRGSEIVAVAEYHHGGAGFACSAADIGEQAWEMVEGAVSYLLAEKAACSCTLDCGLIVHQQETTRLAFPSDSLFADFRKEMVAMLPHVQVSRSQVRKHSTLCDVSHHYGDCEKVKGLAYSRFQGCHIEAN